MIVRRATKTDLRDLYRLARNPKLAAPRRPAAERWWIKSFLDQRQILLVAELNKKIIGFIMGEIATGKVAIAQLLVVVPSHRRSGVATKLGQAFEQECRKRKATCVLLYASSPAMKRLLLQGKYSPGSLVREYQKFL